MATTKKSGGSMTGLKASNKRVGGVDAFVAGAVALVVVEHFKPEGALEGIGPGVGEVVHKTVPGGVAVEGSRGDAVALEDTGTRDAILQAVHDIQQIVELLGEVVAELELEHIVLVVRPQVLIELG